MPNPTQPNIVLALTMGEPGGIGPEVVLKAIADPAMRALARLLVLGDRRVFEQTTERLGLAFDLPDVASDAPRDRLPEAGFMQVADAAVGDLVLGQPSVAGGRASARCIIRGIELAMGGVVDAIVTAPISKDAMQSAGYDFAGHTELLAHYTKSKRAVMLMAGGNIRAALVTTHVALADVPKRITTALILETIEITHSALERFFGIAEPRIAVCGLNPHSGEHGRFGDEEGKVIAPAIDAANAQGINCTGPVPGDVAFLQAHQGKFDAVIAMYHDQGNIPVKLLAFDTGVNITLGLPIIRTSPDHGTAYDIAGRGVADPSAFKSALHTAVRMAANR